MIVSGTKEAMIAHLKRMQLDAIDESMRQKTVKEARFYEGKASAFAGLIPFFEGWTIE